MRVLSRGFLFVWLTLFSFFFFLFPFQTHAQILFPEDAQSADVDVSAAVGQYFLNISGYQSPNASVVLLTDAGLFLASTTADNDGYFTFTDVRITDDLTAFCFAAIDFRRLGESDSCLMTDGPIVADQSYNDIFLPPTIGLSKKLIIEGEDAIIYGYSMPFAEVVIEFDDQSITIQADEAGYYEYIFTDVPAGVYAFSSRATLADKPSLEPRNQAVLEALTIPQQVGRTVTDFAEDLEEGFPGFLILAPLFLIFLALLIALLWKTKPKWLWMFFDKFKKKYPMHHDYFLFKD